MEVLVALAILAIVASLVMPGFSAGMATVSRHSVRLDVSKQLLERRLQAQADRNEMILVDASSAASPDASGRAGAAPSFSLRLADGWTYRLANPIGIRSDGWCDEGTIFLEHNRTVEITLNLEAGTCSPRQD